MSSAPNSPEKFQPCWVTILKMRVDFGMEIQHSSEEHLFWKSTGAARSDQANTSKRGGAHSFTLGPELYLFSCDTRTEIYVKIVRWRVLNVAARACRKHTHLFTQVHNIYFFVHNICIYHVRILLARPVTRRERRRLSLNMFNWKTSTHIHAFCWSCECLLI